MTSQINPEQAGDAVALFYRLIEVLTPPEEGQPDKPMSELKYAESSIARLGTTIVARKEIRALASEWAQWLKLVSAAEWEQSFRKFFAQVTILSSKALTEHGQPNPFANIPPEKQLDTLIALKKPGMTVVNLALLIRKLLENFLSQIAAGDTAQFNKTIDELFKGIFSDQLDFSINLIDILLQAVGGPSLTDEFLDATAELYVRLNQSPLMRLGVSMIEADRYDNDQVVNAEFKTTWRNLRPRFVSLIRRKGLDLPGSFNVVSELSTIRVRDQELEIVEVSIWVEMTRRIRENPIAVFVDSLHGKLANSITKAAVNDLKDEIRRRLAPKRGEKKTRSLDEMMKPGINEENRPDFASPEPPIGTELEENELFDEALNSLDERHREVLELIYKEKLPGNEVAQRLKKSPSWVTKIKKEAIKQLLQRSKDG